MKRWSLLGRAFLFVVCSAVVLAVTSSAMRNLSQTWSPLVIGIVASAATFALTVIFVRWEGLRLADVGAAPGRGSIARFGVGFLLGLILVASHSAVLSVTGHVHWVRGPRVSAGVTIIALFGYVALACREELSFRGYPLRRLWKPFGLWGAQVIVAILFAIEHVLGGAVGAGADWSGRWITALWHGGDCNTRPGGADRASRRVELRTVGARRKRIGGNLEAGGRGWAARTRRCRWTHRLPNGGGHRDARVLVVEQQIYRAGE